jgi:ATP-dependent helicase HrpB
VVEPLPVDQALPEIRAALAAHRAVVVVAPPGAGKTTRVPPALLDHGPAIVLQPRRAAARAIARRLATERGWTLGHEVGWQVRFERNFSRQTRLLIATEGILTARLQSDPLLSDFSTIVIDEFHERSIHADVAIALSKQATLARTDLWLVVMSATMDAARVAAYLGGCPVVRVAGQLHPVHVEYHPHLSTTDAVRRLTRETDGTVLCFEPGAADIQRTVDALRRDSVHRLEVLPLHGGMPAADQDLALAHPGDQRRVVVCTNIAETSVTVPHVTGIVDSGLEKVARYDAALALDTLSVERISQAAADQRAGRAGRTGAGRVYRLWEATSRLRPYRDADIHRIDLAGAVLDIAGWGGDARSLDWFSPPRAEAVDAACALLHRMGALKANRITEVGARMLALPLPPRLARFVVAADGHPDAIRAAVFLSERRTWSLRSSATTSDVLPALDQWNEVAEHVRLAAGRIQAVLAPARSPAHRTSMPEADLRHALLTAYPDRVAQRRALHSPRFLMSTGTGAVLTPESGVRTADYLIALELQGPTRKTDAESRIRVASAVDRDWLTATGSDMTYSVDERGVVKARARQKYDALILRQDDVAPDPDRAAQLMAEAWAARPRTEAEQQVLARLRFAGARIDIDATITAAARGVRSVDDIDLARALPHDVGQALARNAPESVTVPSGRNVPLVYRDDGTVSASVKLQELFGLAETPHVGPQRQPVILLLLAPNGRPVQTTRDLKSFWDRTYPDVRKELRGRYPKHPWPDDPWSAVPTHRTKRRA